LLEPSSFWGVALALSMRKLRDERGNTYYGIDHPLFFFIQFHQSGSFPKMGVKKRHRFFTYGVGNRKRVLMFCISAPFEPASI